MEKKDNDEDEEAQQIRKKIWSYTEFHTIVNQEERGKETEIYYPFIWHLTE